MKYYKTQTEIRAIEHGQEYLIQNDWVLLTDDELHALLNPPKTEEQITAEVKAEAQPYLDSTDWITSKYNDVVTVH